MPNMPKAVHHAASNNDGIRFYIFGGRVEGNPLSDGQTDVQVCLSLHCKLKGGPTTCPQIYDPATNTWLWSGRGEVAAMPVGRTGSSLLYKAPSEYKYIDACVQAWGQQPSLGENSISWEVKRKSSSCASSALPLTLCY